MPALREYFAALDTGVKMAELKQVYEGIRAQYPEPSKPGTKDQMTEALRAYEAEHVESEPGRGASFLLTFPAGK
jgi:hypothetical protein